MRAPSGLGTALPEPVDEAQDIRSNLSLVPVGVDPDELPPLHHPQVDLTDLPEAVEDRPRPIVHL